MNLQLELTNVCNIQCVECPNHLMKRPRRFMLSSVFEKVLRDYIIPLRNDFQTQGHPPTLILHKDGEPLLHRNIVNFIYQVSQARPDIKIDIYTNGLHLTQAFLDFLGRTKSNYRILVSFHFYNANGKPNEYLGTDLVLTNYLKNPYPNIEMIFTSHVTRFISEDILNAWKENWLVKIAPKKIDIHVNKHINPWTGLIHEENCVTFDACPYPDGNHLFIGVTGNVLPCCMDLEEELTLCNIMDTPVSEVFGEVNNFYSNMISGAPKKELCLKCLKKG